MAVSGILAWIILRRVGLRWSVVAFLLVTVTVSSIVVNDVRIAGVVRDDSDPDYSIVYYNSTALFPLVIQKHNNWTAGTFVYYVLFLEQSGAVVFHTGPNDDQSEFMHWALFSMTVMFSLQGLVMALVMLLSVESVLWLRKPDRMELLK